MVILSDDHFVWWSFCQMVILSHGHKQMVILSGGHFLRWSFLRWSFLRWSICQMVILPNQTWHLAEWIRYLLTNHLLKNDCLTKWQVNKMKKLIKWLSWKWHAKNKSTKCYGHKIVLSQNAGLKNDKWTCG